MLVQIDQDVWYAQHAFKANGLLITSRMTVVRKAVTGALWIHSPIPLTADLQQQIKALGEVRFVVAPNKVHHLFMAPFLAAFPGAVAYGAPGLSQKRPDLTALQTLSDAPGPWSPELECQVFLGMPFVNETVWFHQPTKTLILTDLAQWWQGELTWQTSFYNTLMGVRRQFDVPRSVRLLVRDKAAARASANRVLQWRFERVVMAHNAIIEGNAHQRVEKAFQRFQ